MLIDEVTNYIITAPVKQAKSEEIGEIFVEAWYSLEQYIGFEGRQAFHPLLWTSSGLKGTWKLSTYIGLGSLRCAKSVETRNN